MGLGVQELTIIFLIIMVLFGARKLPELAQGLGKGIREFKKATQEIEDPEPPAPPAKPAPENKTDEPS